jgi:peptide/nickel transport system substrate-binding protein
VEKRHLRRRAVLTGGGAAALGGLAAPALAAGSSRTIRYRATLDLVTVDPVAVVSTPTQEAALLIYDGLFGIDASLAPQPQMVERFEMAADRLTWRFALRDGLWFHDGDRVRAQDAVASIARWAARDRVGRVLKSRIAEMRAVDDRAFEIRLTRPFPRMLISLATTNLFVLPERVAAHTDAAIPVKDLTGSGPFIFEANEWVSGARAAFRRNPRYEPRQEKPSLLSGGKMAYVDRVEWTTMPDAATASAALQNDEIDLIHVVDADMLPLLRKNKNVVIEQLNRFGYAAELVFDTLIPPADNAALRRALLLAVNQEDCMRAVVGDETDLMRTGVGVFTPGTPLANDVGLAMANGSRDMRRVRQAVRESGYGGERFVVMVPTDSAALLAFGSVICQCLKDAGLNVDVQAMDWGSVVSRRNQPRSGGWHAFSGTNPGQYCTPGTHLILSSPSHDDAVLNALRDSWYDAPDPQAERHAAEQIQLRFFENPPALPLGHYYPASAYRAALSDLVPAPWAIFWGAKKA